MLPFFFLYQGAATVFADFPSGDYRHRKVMLRLDHNDSITRAQAEKITDSSSSSAGRLLKGMVDDGSLRKEGRGRRTRYIKTSE